MTDVLQIPLTKGKVALVDADDYESVTAHEWLAVCSNGRWYAARFTWKPKRQLFLHRFLLGTPRGRPRRLRQWRLPRLPAQQSE